jgi:Sec-independent protein secretion pathway component TatC
MSKRKFSRIVVVDVFLVIFWAAIVFFELLFVTPQDIVWIIVVIVALVCFFVFSALLGRDIRRQRMQ